MELALIYIVGGVICSFWLRGGEHSSYGLFFDAAGNVIKYGQNLYTRRYGDEGNERCLYVRDAVRTADRWS